MRQRYGTGGPDDYQRPSDGQPLRVRLRGGGEGAWAVPGEVSGDEELHGQSRTDYGNCSNLRCDRCGVSVDIRSRVPGERHRCGGRLRRTSAYDLGGQGTVTK